MSSNIRSITWVADHLQDASVRIVDCRFALGQPLAGHVAYAVEHIPGAVYFDLEKDMSAPIDAHGGRHPLPEMTMFAAKLAAAGISQETTVVAYDDQGGAMSSRFWWMLQYLGHKQTAIMDQGFAAWKAAGYPVTAEVPSPQPALFELRLQPQLLLGMDEVRARLGRSDVVLLDSREERRYLGLEEPIDKTAGHIPGARNAFWKLSLHSDGTWKNGEELRRRFAALKQEDTVERVAGLKQEDQAERLAELKPDTPAEIVVYCGSGVTACPNVLALTEAGFRNVKLYAGSWSDWISYEDNPVATGEE